MNPRRIAFLKWGSFSYVNNHVEIVLRQQFPDHDLDVLEASRELVNKKTPANLLCAFRECGIRMFRDRQSLSLALSVNSHMQKSTTAAAARRISPRTHSLVFQTHTMFDGRVPGVPGVVYTDHGDRLTEEERKWDMERFISTPWQRTEAEVLEGADLILTMSRSATRSLETLYVREPGTVHTVNVGGGLPLPGLKKLSAKDYSPQQILFVGKDWERKGGPLLVEAFRNLVDQYPEAHLTVVSRPLNIKVPNARFLTGLSVDHLHQEFEKATIYCLPTRFEFLGVSMVEAMGFGLPVIGTDIFAMPEFIKAGESGYRARRDDVGHLTELLQKLLDDPAHRRELGAAGRRIVDRDYNWDVVGQRIGDAIREHLGDRLG